MIEMEFLKENKDILFEISKYLSRYDMKRLFFALDLPNLKFIFEQRNELLKRDQQIIKQIDIADKYMLTFIFNAIFQLNYNSFLISSSNYDVRRRILTCRIDYQELEKIFNLGKANISFTFDNAVIIAGGFLLDIENMREWFIWRKWRNVSWLGDDHNILTSYINDRSIYQYIDTELEMFSKSSYYFDFFDQKFYLNIDLPFFDLIWNYLPEKNKQRLRRSIIKYEQAQNIVIDETVVTLLKIIN